MHGTSALAVISVRSKLLKDDGTVHVYDIVEKASDSLFVPENDNKRDSGSDMMSEKVVPTSELCLAYHS